MGRLVFALCLFATSAYATPPALVFSEEGSAAGLHTTIPVNPHIEPPPGGVAVDINRDGWVDVYQPFNVPGLPNRLFLNNGDGTFTESAAAWGVDDAEITRAALFFDYDDDGWLDLVLSGFRNGPGGETCFLRLLQHDPDLGQFVDVTAGSGLDFDLPGLGRPSGMAAIDLDADGDLDLAVGSAKLIGKLDAVDLFFRNNGDGTFTEDRAGLGFSNLSRTWQIHFADFDLDGQPDAYLSQDTVALSRLYRSLGPWSMVDVAPGTGISGTAPDMGIAIGDYDNDGDFDLYVTDITIQCIIPQNQGLNRLFENKLNETGTLAFTEVARARNAASTGVGWGCSWLDIDHDGWLDLVVASEQCKSRLYHNLGNGDLSLINTDVNFDAPGSAGGIVPLDYDRDGDQDILLLTQDRQPQLFRNDGGNQLGNWIVIDPRQRGRNREAVGAIVRVTTDGLTQMRQVTAGCSFRAQEPYEVHFGLGSATVIDRIEITWPDGRRTRRFFVPVNQRLEVVRGRGRRLDAAGIGTHP